MRLYAGAACMSMMDGMTRGPGEVSDDDPDGFVLLDLGEIVDRSPDVADEPAPVLAEGSDIHVVERPSGARAPTTEVDVLLLAYLLDLDDPVRG